MSAGRFRRSFLLLLMVLFGLTNQLRAAPTQSFTLDNGLEVYLKPVASNSKTLDLRLILNFGAADEQVGQRGWAHLIEHMAFSGTERFSAEQIRSIYQDDNFRLGRDINAETGDHHTVYQLSVPQGDVKRLEKNLELMVDWLSAMSFSPDALQREKRVVAAEALERQGFGDVPVYWQDALLSRDDEVHAAIGVMSEVQQATPETLQDFWRSGYRPDRAKLLLSGDFIPAEVIAVIHSTLSPLGSAGRKRLRSTAVTGTPDLPSVVVTSVKDGALQSEVLIARLAEGAEQIQQTTLAMLALHLKLEMDDTPEACGNFQRRFVTLGPERELHYLQQVSTSGYELRCLGVMTAAVQALHRGEESADFIMHLFHRAQSERQKSGLLEANSQVRSIADLLAERLVKGATAVTVAEQWAGVTQWLLGKDTADVARSISSVLDPQNLSLVVQTSGTAQTLPESEVSDLWHLRTVEVMRVSADAAYTLANPTAQLPLEIIEQSSDQRTLLYGNGAQVHLLKTDSISDHFDVLLVREGGLLSLPSQLVTAAARLPVLLPQRGFDSNTSADVRAGIKKHKLGFSWFVENFRQGLRGSARGADASALFSMLHHSQQPLPANEYQAMDANKVDSTSGEEGQRQLRRVIWRALYDLGEPTRPEAPVELNAEYFQSARDHLFSGASGLHLYIAGDFDEQAMQALSDQYIGSLPESASEQQVPGLFASDKRRRIVHHGNQPTRADMLFYYVQSASNELERYDAELLLMREVLAQRLWHVLREREGLGYDVSLQLQRRAYQRGGSSLKVSMVCDPSFAGAVRKGVDEVLLSLLVQGVDEFELAPLRGRLSADYNALLQDNAALLDEWANQRERGRSIVQVLRTVSEIEQVDAARLQQFARLFFKETGFLEVNVVPGLQVDRGGEQAALVSPVL